jgi:hypothetical protein
MSDKEGGVPVYIDPSDPEIDDPAAARAGHRWHPADPLTNKLIRCVEALRDISTALAPLESIENAEAERRFYKQAVVPIYSLATAIRDVVNDMRSNKWSRLSGKSQKEVTKQFRLFEKRVPTSSGALRTARDKIAAHIDKNLYTWERRPIWEAFDLRAVVGWANACVEMLVPLLAPDVFSWSRDSAYPGGTSLMNVDGSEITLADVAPYGECIVSLTLTKSPKEGVVREAKTVWQLCRRLRAAWDTKTLKK